MMDLSRLHCLIDCSGSMAEYGKPMLMINLLRYIRQFADLYSKEIEFFTWGNNISPISWSDDQDIELPTIVGSSDIADLCHWCDVNKNIRNLVLTDGYFSLDEQQRYALSQSASLYLIGVGGDANLSLLKTISHHSYMAEQLDEVLHTLWRDDFAAVSPPINRVDLSKPTVGNQPSDGDDDEW